MNTTIKTFSVKTIMFSFYSVCLFFGALHAGATAHKRDLSPLNLSEQEIWNQFKKLEPNKLSQEEDARRLEDIVEQVKAMTTEQQEISKNIFELIDSDESLKAIDNELEKLEQQDFFKYEYKKGYLHLPLLEEGDSILHAALRNPREDREALIQLILRKAQEKGVYLEQLLNNSNEKGETPLNLAQFIDADNLLPVLQLPSLQSYTTSSSSSLFTTTSSPHDNSSFFDCKSHSDSNSSSSSNAKTYDNPSSVYNNYLLAGPSTSLNSSKRTLTEDSDIEENNPKHLKGNTYSSSVISNLSSKKLNARQQEELMQNMRKRACLIIKNKTSTNTKKELLENIFQIIEQQFGKQVLDSFINYQRPETGKTLLDLLEHEEEQYLYIYLIKKGAKPFTKGKFIKNKDVLIPGNMPQALKEGRLNLVKAILCSHPEILQDHFKYSELISDVSISFLYKRTLNYDTCNKMITFIIKNENGSLLLNHHDTNFLHFMFTRLSQLLMNSHTNLDIDTQILLKDIFNTLKQSELPKIIYQSSNTQIPLVLINMIMELIGNDHCYNTIQLGSILNSPSPQFDNKTPLDLLPPTYTSTKLQLESEGFTASSSSSHTTSSSTFLNSSSGSSSSSSSSDTCIVQ